MRISIEKTIDNVASLELLRTYRAAFAPLAGVAAEPQALSDDEFLAALGNESVLKFVARDVGGETSGLGLLTTDLSVVHWIDPDFYRRRYPDHFQRGAIFYVLSTLIHPDQQGSGLISALVEAIALRVGLDLGVLAFDSCRFNIDNFALPDVFKDLGSRHVEADCREIDAQHYYGYEVTAIRELDLRDRKDHGVDIDLSESDTVDLTDSRPTGSDVANSEERP